MDLETENRLAALLMEEARRLRAQADKEGVHAYLRQPNVRGWPNSRFLSATVLGVQQANRAVEVNEMWRAREKELELNAKLKGRSKDEDVDYADKSHNNTLKRVGIPKHEERACRTSASSSKRRFDRDACYSTDDGGLRDDEVEEFLSSRAKRGRGAIGSRMDEPVPYPLSKPVNHDGNEQQAGPDSREKEEWEHRVVGPPKPSFIKSSHESSSEEHYADSSKKKHRSTQKKRISKEGRSKRKKTKEKKKSKHIRHHDTIRADEDVTMNSMCRICVSICN